MTVCVAIKVHDCIVFAADSAISLTTTSSDGTSWVSNVWKHGLKVFNLHRRNLPIVAMSAGMANFGSMSITNLSKGLRISLEEHVCCDGYTLEDVVSCADQYFKDEYEKVHTVPNQFHSFEFWIGGYSPSNKHGEIWKCELRGGQWMSPEQLVQPEASNQILWGGQIQAISRLLLGCDPQIVQTMNLDAANC